MPWSASELHRRACSYLDDNVKHVAGILVRMCVIDYKEKNGTAYITITAPPDSYAVLRFLDNSVHLLDLWIAPENPTDNTPLADLPDDIIVLRAIYRAFVALVLDPTDGTLSNLQFRVQEASEIPELQPHNTNLKAMDELSEQDLVQKIIENASTRALGWILEQHCKLRLNTKLEIVFISNHRIARELLEEPESRSTIENVARNILGRDVDVVLQFSDTERQPTDEIVEKILEGICDHPRGLALGCSLKVCISMGLCKIIINTSIEILLSDNDSAIYDALPEMEKEEIVVMSKWLEEPEARKIIQDVARTVIGRDIDVILRYPSVEAVVAAAPPSLTSNQDANLNSTVDNQCRQFDNNPVCIWENLRFRSHTEIRIAQTLDKRKVLFLPNCAARLGFSRRQNREADFLVCEKGKWGILEVDSPDSHPPARTVEDHERARLFQAHGILLVQHFDGGECFENADGVVDKFLYLLRNQK